MSSTEEFVDLFVLRDGILVDFNLLSIAESDNIEPAVKIWSYFRLAVQAQQAREVKYPHARPKPYHPTKHSRHHRSFANTILLRDHCNPLNICTMPKATRIQTLVVTACHRPFARSLEVKAEGLHSAFVDERPGHHSCYAGSHHARFGPLTDLTAVSIRVPTLPSVEIFWSAPITCRVLLLSLSRGVRRRISGVKDL